MTTQTAGSLTDFLALREQIMRDVPGFCAMVRRGGFAPASGDLAGILYGQFVVAARQAEDTPSAAEPWRFVRSIASDIYDQANDLDACRRLITTLHGLRDPRPPGEVYEQLTGELGRLDFQASLQQISGQIESHRLDDALAFTTQLAARETDPERIADLKEIEQRLVAARSEGARTRRFGIGLVAGALVVALVLTLAVSQSGAPAPEATVAQTPVLDRKRLRACQFDYRVLEAAARAIPASDVALTERYKREVAYYARTCSTYHYDPADMESVQIELRNIDFDAEGARLIRSWKVVRPR